MNNIIPRHENGNGAIGGRGVQRRKMTLGQRISLGADVALGLAQVDPSIAQSAAIVGVSPAQISAEIKARAKAREDAERAKREAAVFDVAYAANQLIDAWHGTCPQAREVAVEAIGIAAVWDTIVGVIA